MRIARKVGRLWLRFSFDLEILKDDGIKRFVKRGKTTFIR